MIIDMLNLKRNFLSLRPFIESNLNMKFYKISETKFKMKKIAIWILSFSIVCITSLGASSEADKRLEASQRQKPKADSCCPLFAQVMPQCSPGQIVKPIKKKIDCKNGTSEICKVGYRCANNDNPQMPPIDENCCPNIKMSAPNCGINGIIEPITKRFPCKNGTISVCTIGYQCSVAQPKPKAVPLNQ